jgi:hypothetical protein
VRKTGERILKYIYHLIITLILIVTTTTSLVANETLANRWQQLSNQLQVSSLQLTKLGKFLSSKRQAKHMLSSRDLVHIRKAADLYMVPAMEIYQLVTNQMIIKSVENRPLIIQAKLELINSLHPIIDLFYDDSTLRRSLRDQSQMITHSPITLYNLLYREKFKADLPIGKIPFKISTFPLKDLLMWPLQKGLIFSAFTLGKISGALNFFDGDLIADHQVRDSIASKLKPLDVLLEKKASSLTDLTIPGYWGHNAIWLGTKEDLVELGIWDAPELDYFRPQIEQGNSIYEVRRWGLQFDNLNHWMDLDSIAAVRVNQLIASENMQIVLDIYSKLAAMSNAEYDYLFDYYLPNKITCGELLFHSYQNIAWPTERKIGLGIITPSLIGELALYQNAPISLVAFASGLGKHTVGKLLTFNDYAEAMDFRYHPDYPEILAKHRRYCYSVDSDHDDTMEQECEDRYQILDYNNLVMSYKNNF